MKEKLLLGSVFLLALSGSVLHFCNGRGLGAEGSGFLQLLWGTGLVYGWGPRQPRSLICKSDALLKPHTLIFL